MKVLVLTILFFVLFASIIFGVGFLLYRLQIIYPWIIDVVTAAPGVILLLGLSIVFGKAFSA